LTQILSFSNKKLH